jgi:serine/threonine protein kinase
MRLIDFGCAKVAADDEVISDVAGSPYYCSPEVGFPFRHRAEVAWARRVVHVCACVRACVSGRARAGATALTPCPLSPRAPRSPAQVLSESYVRTGRVWKAADMWCVGLEFTVLRGMA